MKTLPQVQEENRKAIIMACNPEAKTYEEALHMELGLGCIIMDILHQFFGKNAPEEMLMLEAFDEDEDVDYKHSFLHYRGNPFVYFNMKEILDKDRFTVMGKPLTFNRVLSAIDKPPQNWDGFYITLKAGAEMIYLPKGTPACDRSEEYKYSIEIYWDFDKDTLEEQHERVQREINVLLGGGE